MEFLYVKQFNLNFWILFSCKNFFWNHSIFKKICQRAHSPKNSNHIFKTIHLKLHIRKKNQVLCFQNIQQPCGKYKIKEIYVIRQPGGPYWEKLCRGRRLREVLNTEGTILSSTDRLRLVNYIFIIFFLNLSKFFPKEPKWFRALITARSFINWTIFERVNGSLNRGVWAAVTTKNTRMSKRSANTKLV